MYRSKNYKSKIEILLSKSKQIIVFMLMLVISGGILAAQGNFAQRPTYAPGEILVKFKQGVSEVKKMSLRSDGVEAQQGFIRKASLKKSFSPFAIEHWKLGEGESVPEKIAELQQNEDILFAEPNYHMYKMVQPNDEYYELQWGLDSIDWLQVWEREPRLECLGSKPTVAVIDDGVAAHPDLDANLIAGYNVFTGGDDSTPDFENSPYSTHGTAVAGIIGAVTDNDGEGKSGVAWDVKIMPVLFADDSSIEVDDALDAFEWAMGNGADIINYSYGISIDTDPVANAVQTLEDNGVLLIASAGNNEANNRYVPVYPASYTNGNVIAVAASKEADDIAGELSSWSQYGPFSVDIMAPGEEVITTYSDVEGHDYARVSGTSFSAPYVAGIAALIMCDNPSAKDDFYEVKGRIIAGAVQHPSTMGKAASGGAANVANSLDVTEQPVLVVKSVTIVDDNNGILDGGETVNLEIEIENVWQDAIGVTATLKSTDELINDIDVDPKSYGNIEKGESKSQTFRVSASSFNGHKNVPFQLEISDDSDNPVIRHFPLEVGRLVNEISLNALFDTTGYDDAHYYHFYVPVGAEAFAISTISASNIDLFVMRGEKPKVSFSHGNDEDDGQYYYSYPQTGDDLSAIGFQRSISDSGNEEIKVNNPVSGHYFALVYDRSGEGNISYSIEGRGISEDSGIPDNTGDDTDSGGGSVPLQLLILLGGIALFSKNRNSLS